MTMTRVMMMVMMGHCNRNQSFFSPVQKDANNVRHPSTCSQGGKLNKSGKKRKERKEGKERYLAMLKHLSRRRKAA